MRGRITLSATALVALTLIGASFAIVRLVENDLVASAEEALDDALEQAADVSGVSIDNRRFPVELDGEPYQLGVFTVDEETFAYGNLYDGGAVVAELYVDIEEGEVVEIYAPETDDVVEDAALREQLGELVFDALDAGGDQEGTLLVGAVELTDVDASLDAVRRALLVIVPILVLASGLLTWWLVGRSLRPVHAITRRVDAISSTNLHERVPAPAGHDEVAELAAVMNDMLDRLEQGSDRQRQFSGDASHELRSPLSTVRAAAEMIERTPGGERVPSLASDIVAETDRMDQLIGDLLELARLDEQRSAGVRESLDLAVLVADEVDPGTADVEVRAGGPVIVEGNEGMLRRLLRNLVDNAARHASDHVSVLVQVDAARALVEVHDDGAGVPVAERETVFERFTRLDEARGRDAGGAGLGLALVKAIAVQHGGDVFVGESAELGGARFVVELPVDQPAVGAVG